MAISVVESIFPPFVRQPLVTLICRATAGRGTAILKSWPLGLPTGSTSSDWSCPRQPKTVPELRNAAPPSFMSCREAHSEQRPAAGIVLRLEAAAVRQCDLAGKRESNAGASRLGCEEG